ncbi:hypothetical protein ABII15_08550 [Streptomyces sp. HUAS MG91]|uniref:Low molecular weight antigen MTB12-like C-terminal domain-containing protein n=1 Tax=Streptomyces tabacisoli TaxID=3156398 RepID=A0AAU8IQ33_9ACTN
MTVRYGRGAALAAVLALGPGLTACGGSGGSDGSSSTPTTHRPSASASATATAPADPAAAERQIKANWKKFFDPNVPLDQKAALLENGSVMQKVLERFNGDRRGGQVRAEVSKVAFTSATTADVTYSLALKGATMLPDAKGASVEEDGVWKVSVRTFCALVRLSGNHSPGPGC